MKCVKGDTSGHITRERDDIARDLVSVSTHHYVNKQAERHYTVERLKTAKRMYFARRPMLRKTQNTKACTAKNKKQKNVSRQR